MAQGGGPEFMPQYLKKSKIKTSTLIWCIPTTNNQRMLRVMCGPWLKWECEWFALKGMNIL
jgi:hypothetical protein